MTLINKAKVLCKRGADLGDLRCGLLVLFAAINPNFKQEGGEKDVGRLADGC